MRFNSHIYMYVCVCVCVYNTGARQITQIPAVMEIFQFIHHLFTIGRFQPECCVVALVYTNRSLPLSLSLSLSLLMGRSISFIIHLLYRAIRVDRVIRWYIASWILYYNSILHRYSSLSPSLVCVSFSLTNTHTNSRFL